MGQVVPDAVFESGHQQPRIRATQTLVSHMSFCWGHPSLTAIEVGWRWLFGVPFLAVLWVQAQKILVAIPPESVGLDKLNAQNPWVSSLLLADAAGAYRPAVVEVLRWLVPVAVAAWAVISALGRVLLLQRMHRLDQLDSAGVGVQRAFLRKVPGVIALQGLWMLAMLGCFWLWYAGVAWAAGTHITSAMEPDLVGYLCWLIFLSLGGFIGWAVLSWTLAMAPIQYVLGDGTVAAALGGSFRLKKTLAGKLIEVNLVMAIVKIALIVLAMVFCAAPLPFSDQFGDDFMHALYVAIAALYLVGNDYFHVVRLRSFVGLWDIYREPEGRKSVRFASQQRIKAYAQIEDDFLSRILDMKNAWLSDESSLWDFTNDTTLDSFYWRIRQVYGVDVSDIRGAILWKIFHKIEAAGKDSSR